MVDVCYAHCFPANGIKPLIPKRRRHRTGGGDFVRHRELTLQPHSSDHRPIRLDRCRPGIERGPVKSAVRRVPVQQVMVTDFKTLGRNEKLGRAVELTLANTCAFLWANQVHLIFTPRR